MPPNSRKIFLGNFHHVKFGHFSGKSHKNSGKCHVKFGHFDNFSYIIFEQKCLPPSNLTELLRLWFCNPAKVDILRERVSVCVYDLALMRAKVAITSKIKHAIKLKTSPARLAQLLQPSLAFCFSLQECSQ